MFKILLDIFKPVLVFLQPVLVLIQRIIRVFYVPKAFSWQTLIYLSLFSWFMSTISQGLATNFIGFCGWIFLILATSWYTTDNPLRLLGIPLGAYITGYLVSVFALGGGRFGEGLANPRTFVLWPTITTLITAVPEFIENGKGKLPPPDVRQKLLIVVGIGTLISCWLQFYHVVDNWLQEYPSLLADNFEQSAFVVRTGERMQVPPNGVAILDGVQPLVFQQLDEKPWGEVEKWLLESRDRLSVLGERVIEKQLANYEEKDLWRVEPRVTNVNSGYNLQLLSIWEGPSSDARQYYLTRNCRITPATTTTTTSVVPARKPQRVIVAQVSCDRKTTLVEGLPPAVNQGVRTTQ